MTTFTKEQLIEQARKNIEVLRGAVERIPGASDAAVIHLKLARIALASLEAEPVIPDYGRDQFEEWFKFHHGEDGSIVALHRANGGANYCDEFVDSAWIAWKDSRAAMQGKADGTLTQPQYMDICCAMLRCADAIYMLTLLAVF